MATQIENESHGQEGKRIRLTLDINPELRRRIKIAAARNDITIREYVERILEAVVPQESEPDTVPVRRRRPPSMEAVQQLFANADRIMRGRVFTDSSADLIREAREERMEEL